MTKERQMQPAGGADGIGEDILAWLARAPGAAFVISPHDAMLLATNFSGAEALGFETEFDGAMPLDSAMPAIMDLRRTANRGTAGEAGKMMALVFWTPDGVARLMCRVRLSGEAGPRQLALIAVEPAADRHERAPVSSAITQPAPDRDDARRDMPPTVAPPPAQAPLVDDDKSKAWERRNMPSTTPQRALPPRAPAERHTPRTVAAAAAMPPAVSAAPLTPPPPPVPRSDDETLKAIARQILAGRQAIAQSTAHILPKEPAAPPRAAPEAVSLKPVDARAPATGPVAQTPLPITNAPQPVAPAPPAPQSSPREAGTPAANKPTVPPTPAIATPPSVAAPADKDSVKQPLSAERRNLLRRLAHELKTPVSAIASAAEIMKDERFGAIGDARYLRYARDIHASAHHALQVIERMLGRSASGDTRTPELAFTDLDLNAILASVVSSLEILAITSGITLKTVLSAKLPRVVADATSVRQIFINTLTNALKFAPRGSTVVVTSHIESGGPLTITVADNGPGISKDEIARIMSGATSACGGEERERPGGGYGIGLPLCISLAAANGATLSIESQPGDGTRVTLAFPGNRQIPV